MLFLQFSFQLRSRKHPKLVLFPLQLFSLCFYFMHLQKENVSKYVFRFGFVLI